MAGSRTGVLKAPSLACLKDRDLPIVTLSGEGCVLAGLRMVAAANS